jgi:glycosyltransferase involved in cell wall biosynthesis
LKTIWLKSKFVILICSYNNEQWVERNLDSVFHQTYTNYRVIYINDASTDQTGKLVDQYIIDNNVTNRCTIIHNQERFHKLCNMYYAIHDLCDDHEIIVELDGDDWLLASDVLEKLAEIYSDGSVWLTYGGFVMWPKTFNYLRPDSIPESIIKENEFRSFFKNHFIYLALRSFYTGLFKKIKKEDLQIDGVFFKQSSDIAIMIPMFEMAGNRFYQIIEPVYLYNTNTGNNDYQLYHQQQLFIAEMIQQKEKYTKLLNLIIF